jgi:hypothetical protein
VGLLSQKQWVLKKWAFENLAVNYQHPSIEQNKKRTIKKYASPVDIS